MCKEPLAGSGIITTLSDGPEAPGFTQLCACILT